MLPLLQAEIGVLPTGHMAPMFGHIQCQNDIHIDHWGAYHEASIKYVVESRLKWAFVAGQFHNFIECRVVRHGSADLYDFAFFRMTLCDVFKYLKSSFLSFVFWVTAARSNRTPFLLSEREEKKQLKNQHPMIIYSFAIEGGHCLAWKSYKRPAKVFATHNMVRFRIWNRIKTGGIQ